MNSMVKGYLYTPPLFASIAPSMQNIRFSKITTGNKRIPIKRKINNQETIAYIKKESCQFNAFLILEETFSEFEFLKIKYMTKAPVNPVKIPST